MSSMRDVDRKCMSCIIIMVVCFFPLFSSQMFDKRPTLYDHMKSGANTVKSNLIDSELKIVTEVDYTFYLLNAMYN